MKLIIVVMACSALALFAGWATVKLEEWWGK